MKSLRWNFTYCVSQGLKHVGFKCDKWRWRSFERSYTKYQLSSIRASIDLSYISNIIPSIDVVGAVVHNCNQAMTMTVLAIYIPPSTLFQNILLFFESLRNLNLNISSGILILGDFNVQ